MKHQMRNIMVLLLATFFTVVAGISAQEAPSTAVAGGGVHVKGWTGQVDAKEKAAGLTLNSAKLVEEGNGLHVTTGPALAYWNPKNVAKGDYTVSATFLEPKYMSINDHPHPYGIMIGGNDLGTENASYLYCATYGNGSYIVRGFGPAPFQIGGRAPAKDDAVNKAAGVGQPVSQMIAVTVKGNTVSCSINNKTVATFDRSAVVTAGKLKSTDGIYGIRFGHNTDAIVTGLKMMKAQ